MISAALAMLGAMAAGPGEIRLTPADIAALPKLGAGAGTSGVEGIRTTVLAGDPQTASSYTIMLQVPANTRIAAHAHRDSRSAVVMSGTWHFGFGAKADDGLTRALPAGSFYTEPGDVAHFARTGDEPVVLYITGVGPTDTRYTEIESDPRP
jgi:uncharacterized RmlC-like cupin family protein